MVLGCVSLLATGCGNPEKNKPIWEQCKIGDIAPSEGNRPLRGQTLNAINFDVHIFEIPSENIKQLNSVWNRLYVRPFEFNSRYAFIANSFVVRSGEGQMLNEINNLLASAGGQKRLNVSLILDDNQTDDLTITGLDRKQTVSYVSSDGSSETISIGPGVLVLRVKSVKVPGSRGVCIFVAQPVLTQPTQSSIPELADMARLREFDFRSVGFGLKMSAGDFFVLGPKKYIDDRSSLGSLFFSNPEGSLFFDEKKLPENKPVVRVFVFACAGMSD